MINKLFKNNITRYFRRNNYQVNLFRNKIKEYEDFRNKEIYKKEKINDSNLMPNPIEVIEVDFHLFFYHYDKESNFLYNLLNFSKVAFKTNNSILNLFYLKNYIKRIEGYSKERMEEYKLPVLKVITSFKAPEYFFGYKEIVETLKDKKFNISDFIFTHSVWEQQGIDLILESIDIYLDKIFLSPKLTFSNTNFLSSNELKENNEVSFIWKYITFSYFHSIKQVFKNYKFYRKEKNNMISYKKNLEDGINKFITRIGDNNFHGGDKMDKADLKLFSILQCKDYNSYFNKYLEEFPNKKFRKWLLLMKRNCKYNDLTYLG